MPSWMRLLMAFLHLLALPAVKSSLMQIPPKSWEKPEKKVILVRTETTPEDIHGMNEAQGILTSHGGMTSHAAVIARGMGKPAVCGAEALKIDAVGKKCRSATKLSPKPILFPSTAPLVEFLKEKFP